MIAPLAFAAEKTRPVLWHMPPALELLWYVLAVLSVVVFAVGVAMPLANYRRGHARWLPARRELWARVKDAIRITASHVSIERRDRYAGWAHRGIFYGFAVLFAGTVILAINSDFTEPVLGWRFFTGDFYLAYSLVLDVFGFALAVGLAMMMFRRGILRPAKLSSIWLPVQRHGGLRQRPQVFAW